METDTRSTWGQALIGVITVVVIGGAIYYFLTRPPVTTPPAGTTGAVSTSTATSTPSTGIVPFESGVRGVVLQGPVCAGPQRTPPVAGCADKPYETSVSVWRAGSDSVYATRPTDANGAFEFSLAPGDYTLNATGEKPFPSCTAVNVTVPATGYATTTINCDTGIR